MSGRVPPSSRARKRMPAGDPARRAALLYERFTGHDADAQARVRVEPLPKVAALIGDCDGVLYTCVRDGKTESYIHEFADADKPLLAVSPDGRQLLLIGGRYRFGARGIVDKSDRKR